MNQGIHGAVVVCVAALAVWSSVTGPEPVESEPA